jgi:hypothetical protein
MRPNWIHTAVGAAVLAAAWAAPAWANPAVAVDRECYLPDQSVQLTGSGFTPNGAVNVFLSALEQDAAGAFAGQAAADGSLSMQFTIDRGFLRPGSVSEAMAVTANDMTLVYQGAGPDTAVGFDTFLLSDVGVHVDAWDDGQVKPRARTTFRIFGLNDDLDERVYAHYLLRGRVVKSVALGRLEAPCGDLVARKRQFAFRPVPAGRYTVLFNAEPRYAPSTPSVAYPRTVRVTRRRAVSPATR